MSGWRYQKSRKSKKVKQHIDIKKKDKQRSTRRVWIYQSGNQDHYIEEEHTTQWIKEKVSTTIYKTYT